MKMTAFNGSPRGIRGNTHRIVDALLTGMASAGAETRLIQLVDREINHCTGCFACWDRTPGVCIHRDDAPELLDLFRSSDLVVLATPLYTDSMTSILKKFLERILPLVNPQFEHVDGETRHTRRYDHYPDLVVVSNCGYPELSQFQVLRLLFDRLARELDVTVKFSLYRTMGELLKIEHPLVRPIVSRYLKNVERSGACLVQEGSVPDKLTETLEAPLIPEGLYRNRANANWTSKLARL